VIAAGPTNAGAAAEFADHDDKRVFEQATRFQIGQECGDGLVDIWQRPTKPEVTVVEDAAIALARTKITALDSLASVAY
jgi:hypothetical protein